MQIAADRASYLLMAFKNHTYIHFSISLFIFILISHSHLAAQNSLADIKTGQAFKDCDECPEMVVLPAGSFIMGAPKGEDMAMVQPTGRTIKAGPQHEVTVPKRIAIGKFEITFDEWEKCRTCRGRLHDKKKWGRGKRPAINVGWKKITEQYLPWLRKKTGRNYRLPSEAEWEYAARAGTVGSYSSGDKISPKYANYSARLRSGSSKGQRSNMTLPVGSFAPNPWGLHDMHGNVAEWVADCWHDNYEAKPNALKSNGGAWVEKKCEGRYRVVRGGSYADREREVRSTSRRHKYWSYGERGLGFRVAVSLDE